MTRAQGRNSRTHKYKHRFPPTGGEEKSIFQRQALTVITEKQEKEGAQKKKHYGDGSANTESDKIRKKVLLRSQMSYSRKNNTMWSREHSFQHFTFKICQ